MSVRTESQLLTDQKRIWKKAILAAGPRYTSGLNVAVQIEELFEGLAKTKKVEDEINELRRDYRKKVALINRRKVSELEHSVIKERVKKIKVAINDFSPIVREMWEGRSGRLKTNGIHVKARVILDLITSVREETWKFGDEEKKKNQEKSSEKKEDRLTYFPDSDKLTKLKHLGHDLDELRASIGAIDYFVTSKKANLINNPLLLVVGEAGMGKTHLVCDITRDRIKRKLGATIIVLGEELTKVVDPLGDILRACKLPGSKHQILKELNALGEKRKSRSLIIVDAINEADRFGWKRGVKKLVNQIKPYPWVGLVMTCRLPYQYLSLPRTVHPVVAYHQGFAENELEAMNLFFKHYGLPLPEVPLLISEFSSPLFLNSFCRTAVGIKGGRRAVAKGIRDLALGQSGMTTILEDFYKAIEKSIIKKHAGKYPELVRAKWIWGNDNCLVKKIAREMANSGRRYVFFSQVLPVIHQLSGNNYSDQTSLEILKILFEEGILIKDVTWDQNTKRPVEIIKFSFHKFSDHFIARYLLEQHFQSTNVAGSLRGNNPLAKLITDGRSITSNIDLIEALMVEFPARVKNNPQFRNREFVEFIPRKFRSESMVRKAFIESLYWRDPKTFLNKRGVLRKSIVDYINKTLLRYSDSSKDLLDLFVSTATKPSHPLSAKSLSNFLKGFSLVGRDLYWTEYIRLQYEGGGIRRLVSWIENQDIKSITPEQAWCVITILGWALTTTDRSLRTRITRCIFIVGNIQPEVCFKVTIQLLDTNDPYVSERMLAASYGVALTNAFVSGSVFHEHYSKFAKQIYSAFFKVGAHHSTTHIYSRDYASGILELALEKTPKMFSKAQKSKMTPPYKTGGRRRWGRTKDKDRGQYRNGDSPLGMDFENYTLGSLVPHRRNYDNSNRGFIKVKENILWRIYNLGYSLEKFSKVDQEIVSRRNMMRNEEDEKVDRYGKKYAWIAYFELLGLMLDRKEADDYYVNEVGRNREIDIDPSFPEAPKVKKIIDIDLTKGKGQMKRWLVNTASPDISNYLEVPKINKQKGPWVLVRGYVSKKNTKLTRKTDLFLIGLLAKSGAGISRFLNTTDYPGNDKVPSNPEVAYMFAGELGWREKINKKQTHSLDIQVGEKRVRMPKVQQMLFIRYLETGAGDGTEEEGPRFRMQPIYQKIPVEPLARTINSRDFGTPGKVANNVSAYIPSVALLKRYKLHNKPRSFDFSDRGGRLASISVVNGNPYGTCEELLFVRKDLLKKLVRSSKKKLFLLAWGERRYWPRDLMRDHRRKDISDIYERHANIFKKLYRVL